jgi:hypothetical protein
MLRRVTGEFVTEFILSWDQITQTSGLSFMMDVLHGRQQMGSAVSLRNRDGQSETPAPE